MLKYEEIYEIVKSKLSDKRFYHSVCVVERCIEYAKIYGVDLEKIKIAGIVHDIAKEIPKEEQYNLAQKYNIELDEIEKLQTPLIHSKLGAVIAKKEYNCSDDICEAIKYHTTGKENMNLMEKILFISDATSRDRKYENTEYLYNLSKKSLDEAILELLKFSITDLINNNLLVHPNSIKAFNYLLLEK